jgi:hypothetical protein
MPKKEEEIKKEEAIVEKIGCEAVGVYDKGDNFVREYSAGAHGEGFTSLAKGFAKKKGYTVRKLR